MSRHINKKSIIITLFIIIVGFVVGWWLLRRQDQGVEKKYIIKPTTLKQTINLSGVVEAEEKTTLRFQTAGKLVWVGVKEGDTVQKWQAVASLDQRELKKTLEKKLSDFLTQRWTFDQTKDDYKSAYTGTANKYLSDEITRIVEKSQFGLDKTILDVEIANLTIELSTLISPIDGIVTRVTQPIPGVNITTTNAEFDIINPATLFLKAVVDQQDVVRLAEGTSAEVIFDAFPEKTFEANIYYTSFVPEAGEENAYVVKMSIPQNIPFSLRVGMGAEITLTITQKKNALAVPFEALKQENGDKTYVLILQGNKHIKQLVTTGVETDILVEIVQGLKEGQVVVY